MTEALCLWFLLLFGVGIVVFLIMAVRFRGRRVMVERKIGPLPTPIPLVVQLAAVLILLTRTGEMSTEWPVPRLLGLGLSLYAVVIMPWALRTLGRFFVPGVAVFRDHALVTSGPFRLVRHPLYSAVLALWVGAALGTLNWLLFVLLPLVVAGLFMGSRAEEAMLRAKFGTSYEAYTTQTGRFIPKVWGGSRP